MRVPYPKLRNIVHKFTASKGLNLYILFAITAAGVVPCGGPTKSPRTSSIVQIKFSFGPLRLVKILRMLKDLRLET